MIQSYSVGPAPVFGLAEIETVTGMASVMSVSVAVSGFRVGAVENGAEAGQMVAIHTTCYRE